MAGFFCICSANKAPLTRSNAITPATADLDGELDAVETANWVPKLLRKDFTVAQSLSGSAVDDPDTQFYKN